MNYFDAWIELIKQRDMLYLQIAAAVIVGFVWYRLWLRFVFKLALAGAIVIVGAGLGWGLFQILQ